MSATLGETEGLYLIPIDPDTNKYFDGRPKLSVGPDSLNFYLGENDDTEIVDPKLSAKVVKVYNKRGKVFAFVCQDARGDVEVNKEFFPKGSRRELHEGDVISLYNRDDNAEYRYRVGHAKDNGESQKNKNAATATTTSNGSAAVAPLERDCAVKAEGGVTAAAAAATTTKIPKVSEDATCAICMEIMFDPRTIVPCGHSMCRECLEKQNECAECRGPIHGQVTCRALHNLIENLVTAQKGVGVEIFEMEDLDSYVDKKKKADDALARADAQKRRRVARSLRLSQAVGSASNVICMLE